MDSLAIEGELGNRSQNRFDTCSWNIILSRNDGPFSVLFCFVLVLSVCFLAARFPSSGTALFARKFACLGDFVNCEWWKCASSRRFGRHFLHCKKRDRIILILALLQLSHWTRDQEWVLYYYFSFVIRMKAEGNGNSHRSFLEKYLRFL